jgi:hypothetical protein
MNTNAPKEGQRVRYKGEEVGVVVEVGGNICTFQDSEGETEVFLWRMASDDTHNTLFTWEDWKQTTEQAFNHIMSSNLFRLDGHKLEFCDSIITLCDCIKAEEDTNWSLGECGECTLDSLIVASYWALIECHGGQSSESYKALCVVGSIFKPGSTNRPTEEDSERHAFNMICNHFEAGNN